MVWTRWGGGGAVWLPFLLLLLVGTVQDKTGTTPTEGE